MPCLTKIQREKRRNDYNSDYPNRSRIPNHFCRLVGMRDFSDVKPRQDAFVTQYYKVLDQCIDTNLKRYHGPYSDELALEIWERLLLKISEKAFIDSGWAEELDCLRQSKSKIYWLTLTVMKKTIKEQQIVTDSYDKLLQDQDEGLSLPSGFLESASTEEELDPERQMMRKQLAQAIRQFATSDYENAILDWVMKERQAKHIIADFSVNKNRLTADRNELLRKIRSELIIEDYI